jgi:hypothetical protein
MLNEQNYRKPEWIEGVWLKLADSGVWSFRKPNVHTRPEKSDDSGRFCMLPDFSEEPELGKLNDQSVAAAKCENYEHLFLAWFGMAINLLEPNYALGDEEMSQLLVIHPDSEFGNWRRGPCFQQRGVQDDDQ